MASFAIELEPEVDTWLGRRTPRELATVDVHVGDLAKMGAQMPMPRARPLKNGLYELRFTLSSKAQRIKYWFGSDDRIILLTVFHKIATHDFTWGG
jgi:hypothetical protein